MKKITYKYRKIAFAGVMSFATALIISGIINYLHAAPGANVVRNWLSSFITVWPIVFLNIIVIAPLADRFVSLFVEQE